MSQSPSKAKLSQQQFQDKLNQIVRIIKLKQEICLQVIEYLQEIVLGSSQLSKLMFLHDEMSRHKIFQQKMHKKNLECKTKEKSVHFFYSEAQELTETERSLVRRVSARILEMFQSFNEKVEKYSHFQKQITLHYRLAKPKFLKHINQVDKNGSTMFSIVQLCNSFFSYLQGKFTDQCKKISKIIELIQNGQIHQIETAYVCQHCQQMQKRPQPRPVILQSKSPIKPSQPSSKNLTQTKHSQQIHQLKYFSKEKQKINQKLKALRLQAKNKQLIRKQKSKFANKYYALYQSAMDLHKGYLVEELTVIVDQKEHKERMLTEMQARNRFNSQFIHEYIHVCEEKNMLEKVRFSLQEERMVDRVECHTQQKQVSDKSSKRVNTQQNRQFCDEIIEKEVSDCNSPYNIKQLKNIEQQSQTISAQNEQRAQIKSFRITNPNKKAMIPTPKSNPNLFSIKQLTQIGQSYNFVKINMKGNVASNPRARLPDISNRLFSMDDKHKSTKIIDRPDTYVTANNNLLIIKTSLNSNTIKRDGNGKKEEKKKPKVEQNATTNPLAPNDSPISPNHARPSIPYQNNPTIPTKIQKKITEYPIHPLPRNKKIKRSESGNKLILQSGFDNNNNRGSYKNLEINFSSGIGKKIKNYCDNALITTHNKEG